MTKLIGLQINEINKQLNTEFSSDEEVFTYLKHAMKNINIIFSIIYGD